MISKDKLMCICYGICRTLVSESSKLRIIRTFVKANQSWPVYSPHKRPVMRKALPCHDVSWRTLSQCNRWSETTNAETYQSLGRQERTRTDGSKITCGIFGEQIHRTYMFYVWGQHGAHLGPTGPRWAHVGPKNFAILGVLISLRPRQNRNYFAENVFRWICLWK